MPKLLVILFLFLGYLIFLLPSAFAAEVKVGPIKLIVPKDQPLGSLKVSVRIKEQSGKVTEYTLGTPSISSDTRCGGDRRFQEWNGPCLPEQTISIGDNSKVRLFYTGVERWIQDSNKNWVQDAQGKATFQIGEKFSDANELTQGIDLNNGDSAKWVAYNWDPSTPTPSLNLTMGNNEPIPQIIPSGTDVKIIANFPRPYAPHYEVKIVPKAARGQPVQENIGLIPVDCSGDTCGADMGFARVLNNFSFTKFQDKWILGAIIPASILTPSSTYVVSLNYNEGQIDKTFNTEGYGQSELKISLEPSEFVSGKATKNQKLGVTINSATGSFQTGTYKAEIIGKTAERNCNIEPCGPLEVNLGEGLEGSAVEDKQYPVTIFGPNNIRATAYLLVKKGAPASGRLNPGDPGFGEPEVKCENGADTNGNPCTQSGGIRCDTSNGEKKDKGDGIMTAIGCVPTEPQKLIQGLFRVGVGFGGAAALLLMIGGAFQFITSAGNPDAIKKATETFTSAVIGLLVIIFAVFFLQVIGVDILNLPGFTK